MGVFAGMYVCEDAGYIIVLKSDFFFLLFRLLKANHFDQLYNVFSYMFAVRKFPWKTLLNRTLG